MKSNLIIHNGTPYPLGATQQENGVNFALFARDVHSLDLCFFSADSLEPLETIPVSVKTGEIWHIFIEGLQLPVCYSYHTPKKGYLQDPYAKEIATGNLWREGKSHYKPIGVISRKIPFDWQGVESPRIKNEDLIIYEMHVRGFTRDSSSQTMHPGTYLGLIEKIPYLKELGINAVELLPIHEFNECEVKALNPINGEPLHNYWGYSTVNFYSPTARYASKGDPDCAKREFQTLVRELHRNGIEVYLDVVYNHTAEGNERGPTYSYKGLANSVYYMLDHEKNYVNISGCGNTFNANHPIVVEHIIDSLRYWVVEMHVDGFRFDLAAALTRGSHGELLHHAPLIAAITEDPILANVKLFSEPWDAHGLYMVGNFWKESPRWADWNGRYRDSVRRFIKGTAGIKGDFITRICGSQDLYYDRSPLNSINFVTVHDGFSLRDLVSYNERHNLANGENNNDGTSSNDSWNCGVEGPSNSPAVIKLREQQMRNYYFTLLVSKGIPLLFMGDEYGHTKNGNNNTWCHDNQLNWFLWDQLEKNKALFRFCSGMIHFRKKTPLLKQNKFLTPRDAEWHGRLPFRPEWDSHNHLVAFTLLDHENGQDVYIAFNAQNAIETIQLPPVKEGWCWHWVVNTGNEPPEDFFDPPKASKSDDVVMAPYSAILLINHRSA